jgi:transcription elongation factor Elf1
MEKSASNLFRCPKCGSEQIDCVSSGLWDGTDKKSHGVFYYGICKQCGSRCAQWDDKPSYVPSDEEWQREIKPARKIQEQRAKWPFIGEDDNVA